MRGSRASLPYPGPGSSVPPPGLCIPVPAPCPNSASRSWLPVSLCIPAPCSPLHPGSVFHLCIPAPCPPAHPSSAVGHPPRPGIPPLGADQGTREAPALPGTGVPPSPLPAHLPETSLPQPWRPGMQLLWQPRLFGYQSVPPPPTPAARGCDSPVGTDCPVGTAAPCPSREEPRDGAKTDVRGSGGGVPVVGGGRYSDSPQVPGRLPAGTGCGAHTGQRDGAAAEPCGSGGSSRPPPTPPELHGAARGR